ncbi:hypothetical protein [Streptomyces griseus]|uniref:hypothetical protein n=1 Tax=Streptomyces griseus TaxID=1911 RepID=UPI00068D9C67|nr:hypothetical protein [Streptomyces griseus]
MTPTDVRAPLRRPPCAPPDIPHGRTEVPGRVSGAPGVPPPAQAGPHAVAGPRTVSTTPAAHGRRTWTHGGGPGSAGAPPARRTTRAEGPRPLAAGAVGTPAPARRPPEAPA